MPKESSVCTVPKRRWRLESQRGPTNWQQEEEKQSESPWRQNYASLVGFADKVEAVLEDQAGRGQALKFTEAEARARFPDLVVASLGAQRKDKPNGVISARVLFDGTQGLAVNTQTRIRDQERSPIAADLKRAVKEKGRARTADLRAHRRRERSSQASPGTPVRLEISSLSTCQGFHGIEQSELRQHHTSGDRVGGAYVRLSYYVVGKVRRRRGACSSPMTNISNVAREEYRFALMTLASSYLFHRGMSLCLGTKRRVVRQ